MALLGIASDLCDDERTPYASTTYSAVATEVLEAKGYEVIDVMHLPTTGNRYADRGDAPLLRTLAERIRDHKPVDLVISSSAAYRYFTTPKAPDGLDSDDAALLQDVITQGRQPPTLTWGRGFAEILRFPDDFTAIDHIVERPSHRDSEKPDWAAQSREELPKAVDTALKIGTLRLKTASQVKHMHFLIKRGQGNIELS